MDETIEALREKNMKLRALIDGDRICLSDDADAHECPLYDINEPYRCKRDRYMRELGLDQ